MHTYRIAVLVGSLRRDSINRKLAQALMSLGSPELQMSLVRIDDLPLYNSDDDGDPAESVQRMRRELAAADGVVFVTPEYNRSISGALKNVIDQGSRPYGHSVWAGKPAGIIGASPGAPGTSMAQQHLRNILAHLDMRTLAQPEVFLQVKEGTFDADGHVGSDAVRALLGRWMARYEAWVELHAAQRAGSGGGTKG